MFKGVGKQVVVLKNTDSAIFEEAIFIVKDGARASRADMLSECERIISINSTENVKNRIKRKNANIIIYITATIALILILGIILFIISSL